MDYRRIRHISGGTEDILFTMCATFILVLALISVGYIEGSQDGINQGLILSEDYPTQFKYEKNQVKVYVVTHEDCAINSIVQSPYEWYVQHYGTCPAQESLEAALEN